MAMLNHLQAVVPAASMLQRKVLVFLPKSAPPTAPVKAGPQSPISAMQINSTRPRLSVHPTSQLRAPAIAAFHRLTQACKPCVSSLSLRCMPPMKNVLNSPKVSQTSGSYGNTLAFNVQFRPKAVGEVANFTGVKITPKGSAECDVIGRGALNTFDFQLEPLVVYSIHCEIVSNFTDVGSSRNTTDVMIYTSTTGAVLGRLFHSSPLASKFEELQWMVTEGLRAVKNLTGILADVSVCNVVPIHPTYPGPMP